MNFDKLHEIIPYAKGGKAKILTMNPYNGITLALPGRHALDTTPVGGDFVVMVDDDTKDWTRHQFTHTDIFRDVQTRAASSASVDNEIMDCYLEIIQGADPNKYNLDKSGAATIHPQTFLYAVQCLAVAEHRRYAKYEDKFGGRYLPFRFAAGIAEGLWTATEAAEKQRRGRPGVEWLEKDHGTPELTKGLMK